MDSKEFRQRGREMVDYIADYFENIEQRRVFPDVQPGYLKELVPSEPPQCPDSWDNIMKDIDKAILPGVTHWQHPHFHAFYPWTQSYPSILADFLVDALSSAGFSWASCPASTELEIAVMDWLANMLGLPEKFHHCRGAGGGVTQNSAGECLIVSMLAARHNALKHLSSIYPNEDAAVLLSKLVIYHSKLAHSCVEKAGMVLLIKTKGLDFDDKHSLRGHTLETAIEDDERKGLYPFFVLATLGTTPVGSFDNIQEIGEVCNRRRIWLHVDAAYAGSSFICPEMRTQMNGIKNVNSLNINLHKWMLMNSESSAIWIDDKKVLIETMAIEPLYLQHHLSENFLSSKKNWSISLCRKFRSLKIWAVIRSYGISGLQRHIRNHCKLAKYFESLMLSDSRFQVIGTVNLGLVCFKLKNNHLTEKLLSTLNSSGKMYLVPAAVNEDFIIRYVICYEKMNERLIEESWNIIRNLASEILNQNYEEK
ncbi:hypothetical protein HELRODRAFT_84539 [Helobdella robusta]|uniref:Aromatic-L-amino-acid decarboxylase n=1 Tax=Helobdella robusta TaxID=6412 RepID=T1G5K0_HELRO|nr:hypothetical protein HELRODRAFT_84539 [Helobdella robusta]ESN98403.1 hypothetical protein HELRODRAFT_84539 [Helobdella robusta]